MGTSLGFKNVTRNARKSGNSSEYNFRTPQAVSVRFPESGKQNKSGAVSEGRWNNRSPKGPALS
jgi:hypothetical protein